MRVLLISAPFGAGHTLAAEAIRHALQESNPADQCPLCDLGDLDVVRLVSAGYLWSLRHSPGIYRTLYRYTSTPAAGGPVEPLARLGMLRRLRHLLAEHRPQVVVATHPFPAAVLGRLRQRGELAIPVASVITDFLPHPTCVHPGIDQYFVSPLAAAGRLRELGVDPGRISATGIPIASGFGAAGEHPGPRRVLVMGGSLGLGPLPELTRSLLQLSPALTVEVVAGSNTALLRELTALSRSHPNLVVHGYSREVNRLMRRAHLLVGKPGGLTCSEALACGLPMLLTGGVPGQEEDNARVLAAAGAARLVSPAAAGTAVRDLLFTDRGRLLTMRKAALRLGRPYAALAVAEAIRQLAGVEPARTAVVQ